MNTADSRRLHLLLDVLKLELDELIQLERGRCCKAGPQQPGDYNTNARLLWKPKTKSNYGLEPKS